jgi:hypothetical protein
MTASRTHPIAVVLGVLLAFGILIGGSSAIAYLMMNRLLGTPPKPMFTNDNPKKVKTTKSVAKKTTAKPSPKPSPKRSLEPGAYEGYVTWPDGLTVRGEPSYEAASIQGIDFNVPVIVLQESEDGIWQKIRIVGTSEEGWVKAGNIAKGKPDPNAIPPAPAEEPYVDYDDGSGQ